LRSDPASAVIAELRTSEANRTITVPEAEGVMKPSMMAMFPSVRLLAFEAAGIS
jgi:hypothetical protein